MYGAPLTIRDEHRRRELLSGGQFVKIYFSSLFLSGRVWSLLQIIIEGLLLINIYIIIVVIIATIVN